MSPDQTQMQTNSPNPLDNSPMGQTLDNNFLQMIDTRLQQQGPQVVSQFEQLLMAADPALIDLITQIFPEFAQVLGQLQNNPAAVGAQPQMAPGAQPMPSNFTANGVPPTQAQPNDLRSQFASY